ncbi:hypothetical protein A2954_04780 [Candidatus Roizmanbacteria bacterium RIFCSPLOWO2_01_FULL_37_12]|uniref:Glycosyl transferase family 1 domain-containing protein n=1 Tax=Candidatus Roizmanbacteria bacterium RIFCSPLOWO2_01_FULL_37_12 TaxID=1802056 RepID=A0A1F7IG04_9BACT|nr:MAG: hypothetical protein A2768_00855 [Candidatus Roizmanbacteria bacterium RIFCSPHIGHO2_01_FULL_37_16]OGK24308.1 MAG: hypothetical protein A3D76_02610 [Candidatus Roizmanbacteria bacterium RIFCSPHIGHO2_02_FULL_37_9b]OGK42294.1 MAG: hypothetical protein A2954_04780 [Candidatus Roizmanbacteria bacterium RIFCSPLOWO2_01_FULL_37_12]
MKIAVAHFRIGLTDGVSLQIEERARILKALGHDLVYIAGSKSTIADLRIPYFEYKELKNINSLQTLTSLAGEIEKLITGYWNKEKFSHIFIHNIFSLPVCLPATLAFFNFLKSHPQVKGIGIHHDFWWDPSRIEKFKVKSDPFDKTQGHPEQSRTDEKLKVYIDNFFPPKLPNLAHTVISKWEQAKLKKRKQITSEVITDTFDFEQRQWQKDKSNKNFFEDARLTGKELKILLASRIRARKGIELGIEFIHEISKLKGMNEVVLLLPNDFFEQEKVYVEKLIDLAKNLKVNIRWLQNLVGSTEEKRIGTKKYSLWDCYVFCDAVIYPSLWEGFGNQFLEAVFAKKPIVVFEYEVFKTDIKPAGFEVISLGDRFKTDKKQLAVINKKKLEAAAKVLLHTLRNTAQLNKTVEQNFEIGKTVYNTNSQLKSHLQNILKM